MVLSINYICSFVLLISILILTWLAYYAWKSGKVNISLSLIAVLIYDFGYGTEILCTSLDWIIFWVRVEYLGGSFLGVLWLIFALDFTGYKEKIRKKRLMLFFIVPIIVLVMNYTNDFHHLFYTDMYINYEGIFPILEVTHGPLYWIHILYTYALMLSGFIIFIISYFKSVLIIRKQILLLLIAWVIPWISDIMYTLHLLPFNMELTSFSFSISGIIISFAVLKFKLLKLNPIALESVFSNMLDGVIILDFENNIVNFNNSAQNIIPQLNYIGTKVIKIQEIFKDYEKIITNTNDNNCSEKVISIKNKEKSKYYKVNINHIYKKNHESIGKILVFNDITESKKQQEELIEFNSFKDKLFTIVSHDIKSPLAVLVSLLEVLEDEDEDIYKEENKEILYEINKNVKNTYTLVENVLDWFKSQMDGLVYNSFSWNLSDIMKNSLMLLKKSAELKDIKVFYEIPEDIFIHTDKNMFEIIVRNLFSNAIKFTYKGGSIKVKAKESDGIVTVAFRDSGIGIESEKIEKLFSYSDCNSTLGTFKEKGTGLGLIICKQLIEKNKGRIWVESSIGKGSTFYFTIAADEAQSKIK